MDPSASLRITGREPWESDGMLWASAGYAPSAHFYPALCATLLQGSTHVGLEQQYATPASMPAASAANRAPITNHQLLITKPIALIIDNCALITDH